MVTLLLRISKRSQCHNFIFKSSANFFFYRPDHLKLHSTIATTIITATIIIINIIIIVAIYIINGNLTSMAFLILEAESHPNAFKYKCNCVQ